MVVKNLPANVGDPRDAGSIPGLGRSPGIESGNPLQYSVLEHSMNRGAWWATVPEAAKSWTPLSTRHIFAFIKATVFSERIIRTSKSR